MDLASQRLSVPLAKGTTLIAAPTVPPATTDRQATDYDCDDQEHSRHDNHDPGFHDDEYNAAAVNDDDHARPDLQQRRRCR